MVLGLALSLLRLNRGALSRRERAVRLVTAILMGGCLVVFWVAKRPSTRAASAIPPRADGR
jgi:hypothetical protein